LERVLKGFYEVRKGFLEAFFKLPQTTRVSKAEDLTTFTELFMFYYI